jgi:hypothetical protein
MKLPKHGNHVTLVYNLKFFKAVVSGGVVYDRCMQIDEDVVL